ncbi:unnamed protein product [Protopolystoma xenopodis]|uniref:Uncharacterized protein n=1 Tax=Protopolystoma xenopodis TaxID=117903 RepID=A0A3S4ZM30_9PLAT|nr:unnamed protein product [Protopolystoma xenopodis]
MQPASLASHTEKSFFSFARKSAKNLSFLKRWLSVPVSPDSQGLLDNNHSLFRPDVAQPATGRSEFRINFSSPSTSLPTPLAAVRYFVCRLPVKPITSQYNPLLLKEPADEVTDSIVLLESGVNTLRFQSSVCGFFLPESLHIYIYPSNAMESLFFSRASRIVSPAMGTAVSASMLSSSPCNTASSTALTPSLTPLLNADPVLTFCDIIPADKLGASWKCDHLLDRLLPRLELLPDVGPGHPVKNSLAEPEISFSSKCQ